ncbi:hypothetical protein E6P09_16515 (plasmid) [Haloferax mediterranei ATCC 33500]|uniref:Uncharacterized protein n=1 Tax=Haloferax mediterranei (strain ATCC 33500 / DSM 1411 / JCM 8866 / NBRC 14739 / NCIMB 2177 / R-4) TaxID=523841 RepID=I3RAZ1_HALMT|nr:hypothetical protein [Haloferax mediterranei]AFK21401.1 hypothetical protein HFX_6279 [Haloferax mediterranei ATCC 33500]AHZ24526.1 hypothetical protein BM92_16595 [Haloferax mediterranei ATCC 33500]ELZ97278.1 hypothetical protein C439_18188 [Haloferax mediterranei ATCC 33500]MDX5990420.1 hypothetical protein [Haloferax mediterranei ATCC 33500]QCQ76922.1 hypothetical protein E6P09_16515 [Haloferax mediterranei ATCC 33500]
MGRIRKSVRIPLGDLRQQVADSIGVAASLVDIHGIQLEDGALEVEASYPDGEDVPAVELFVTDPQGNTESYVTELDGAKNLLIAGEDVLVELVDYDAERGEVFVSVKHRQNGEMVTVLGCGEQWVIPVEHDGEERSVHCRIQSAIELKSDA